MNQYETLRADYPRFLYKNYTIEETPEECKLTYHFEIEGLSAFAPTWRFPKPAAAPEAPVSWAQDPLFREMVFSLGLVELVSYWKITCSPHVLIQCGSLNQAQIAWWKDLYFNGLGEFFYVNHIEEADPDTFMNITCQAPSDAMFSAQASDPAAPHTFDPSAASRGVLVPIGGGKDSAVTLELLREAGAPIYAYIINPRGATIHTTEAAGLDADHIIHVKRTLDPNMLELNRQGYLNGHTPFSALVAFSTIIAARMYGLSYIALSNESSANESTVQGSTVNHQYSKSFKFEEDFNRYERTWLRGSAYYFSMLRPLSEFQIARYFAGKKQYHAIFRSCNAGSKTDSWCGHCPKCLFVYLILSPFLSLEEMKEIFGRDMLSDESLRPTLDQLIGLEMEKPFECVGSRDEINQAISMTIQRLEAEGTPLPALLSYYKTTDCWKRSLEAGDHFSAFFDEENLVPEPWKELVRRNCSK